MASASGSRSTLAMKLVPRSSMVRLLRAQAGGGGQRCGNDRCVAGTAAEMAREDLANLGLGRVGRLAEQGVERHHDSGGAEAALQAVMLAKALLQDRQTPGRRREPFDGPDLGAVGLYGQPQARPDRSAVDMDGAGAADAVFAPDMGAGGTDDVAQKVGQQQARLGIAGDPAAVECDRHRMAAIGSEAGHQAAAPSWPGPGLAMPSRRQKAASMTSRPRRRTSSRR